MPTYTTHYNFAKPLLSEQYNIGVYNDTLDSIDTNLYTVDSNAIKTAGNGLTKTGTSIAHNNNSIGAKSLGAYKIATDAMGHVIDAQEDTLYRHQLNIAIADNSSTPTSSTYWIDVIRRSDTPITTGNFLMSVPVAKYPVYVRPTGSGASLNPVLTLYMKMPVSNKDRYVTQTSWNTFSEEVFTDEQIVHVISDVVEVLV